MNFSICLITRNEEKTLPRLLESLTEYRNRGGEIYIVDTGSSDMTVKIARDAGCVVEEVGDRYKHIITKELADQINERFIVGEEKSAVEEGDTYFDFASARNHVASLAKTDMISFADADECFTSLNIDVINEHIKNGYNKFEYNFVYAHDKFGNETIKFMQSKFYDRRTVKWIGIIHEVLTGPAKTIFLDESILKLEHWQNEETNRSGYLRGLAVDCFNNPENDRNSHYFARELYWHGRPHSAIKEFERHIAMNRWAAERAQSMIFIGDAQGQLGNIEKQITAYSGAFLIDSNRREALIKLARVYQKLNNYRGAAAYAHAALDIPWNAYYANNMNHYTTDPHEILYWAKGWLGDIKGAQYHILEALKYQPENPMYLRDTKYYFNNDSIDLKLPTVSIIIPQLGRISGLVRCLQSIENLKYPKELLDVRIIDGPGTVPEKVKLGVEETLGEYIVYAANDIEFEPDALNKAILEQSGLVAFNTGNILPDEGNICEHFIIKRSLISQIGGVIFDTDFNHVGCDNLLWAKCKKLGQAVRSNTAIVKHYHFSTGSPFDSIYEKAYSKMAEDRELLRIKLENL